MEKTVSVFSHSCCDGLSDEILSSTTFVIRMLSSGFCLAVRSKEGAVLSLNHYLFSGNPSIEEKITAIGETCGQVHLKCNKTVFQLYTNINTQIPEAFYVESLHPNIAELLTEKPKEYVPVGEKISGEPMYNFSLWNAVLMKKINEKFPHCELKTTTGALLEKFIGRKSQEEALVFIEDNHFTIMAKNAKGLLGCNDFAFESEADFLYYCLCFLQNLYSNHAETVPLILCGNITVESPLFASIKKYAVKAELMEKNKEVPDSIVNYHYYCDII